MRRIALDTNILVYAESLAVEGRDAGKSRIALDLIKQAMMGNAPLELAGQVLIELHSVLTRKAGLSRTAAAGRIDSYRSVANVTWTSDTVLSDALELASRHQLQIFDAVILAAAAEARCDVLMSEDMQAGFAWRGVTVVNPFG